MIYTTEYESPVGVLILGEFDGQLCLCDWKLRAKRKQIDERITKGLKCDFVQNETPFLKEVKRQLKNYFDGNQTAFSLPLLFVGTDFQKTIWKKLIEIPFGKKKTYLDLSKEINNVLAIRAVAAANGANAISIVVPCHRIIGSNGEMVGYAGGTKAKQKLLILEGLGINKQLDLFDE